MEKTAQVGYSLVELLVVLTIMAMISIGAFFSLRTLREDQGLKGVVANLQNKIRFVQANASSYVNCNDNVVSFWEVRILKNRLESRCQYKVSDAPIGTLTPGCIYSSSTSTVSCLTDTYNIEPSNISINYVCKDVSGCGVETCKTNLPTDPDRYVSISFFPVSRDTQFRATSWPLPCQSNGVNNIETALGISIEVINSKIEDVAYKTSTILVEKGGVVRAK